MLKIHGPTYRYSGQKLDSPQLIYVQDHHYDPEHGHALRYLLDNSLCPADQHLLVFDHVNIQDEFASYPHVCLPLFLAAESKEFNDQGIVPAWTTRTHAFNFMINKPPINRLILLEMITELSLTNYRHSLCWQQGFASIPSTDHVFGDETRLYRGVLNGSHKNSHTYQHLLKSQVFEPTCVSLITEPAYLFLSGWVVGDVQTSCVIRGLMYLMTSWIIDTNVYRIQNNAVVGQSQTISIF